MPLIMRSLTQAKYESLLRDTYHAIVLVRIGIYLAKQSGDDSGDLYEEEERFLRSLLADVKDLKLKWGMECERRREGERRGAGMSRGQLQEQKLGNDVETE